MPLAKKILLRLLRTRFRLISSVSPRKAAEKAFRLFCTPQSRNRKKLPPVFLSAEKLSFTLGGETVRGYRWNKGSEKKALILHGFESSVVNFEKFVKPLVKKGYEVIAFDAPAHGRSTGRTITVLTYKDMIKKISSLYGPIHSYIAHSFGGLGLSLALEDMPHDDSVRVALIAPAVETTTAIDHFFSLLKLDDAVRKEFDHLILQTGGHPAEWFSVARVAPKLKARILFLQDRKDPLTPYADVRPIMEKNYSHIRFLISEGLGHRRIYKDNDSMKAILEFL